ncbi:MATE family efflux transporter, partial [Acinetobacter baumannii]
LVSHAVARDEHAHARHVAWLALRYAGVVAAVTGALYVLAPQLVLRPFLDPADTATLDIARVLLLIGIVLQFFDAAQNIGTGLLRGLKETGAGF